MVLKSKLCSLGTFVMRHNSAVELLRRICQSH